MGRPAIIRSTLRWRRVEPRRAGITPTTERAEAIGIQCKAADAKSPAHGDERDLSRRGELTITAMRAQARWLPGSRIQIPGCGMPGPAPRFDPQVQRTV